MDLTINICSPEERQKAIAKAAELLQSDASSPNNQEFESLIGAIADYDMLAPSADGDAPRSPDASGARAGSM